MDTNQVRKEIVLKASRERIWRAISDAKQFGSWFGATIDGPFVAGKTAVGRIAPTKADPEVARLQEPYAGFPWHVVVERIEPMTLLSFRWHPHAVDPNHDYSKEPMTLVTFELTEVEGGILLTITETGFDQIPLARRAQAIESNSSGWTHQTKLIEKWLALGQKI
jgi:uncharacterized protein YndB with AHSA1/START domain